MSVAQGRAKHGSVLQLADNAIEAFVTLQRDVLRVLVADRAELAIQFAVRNARTTEPAVGISVQRHMRHCTIRRAAALPGPLDVRRN